MGYPAIDKDAFSLRAVASGERAEVRLTGNADQHVTTELEAALEKLHDVVMHQGFREISFDIRDLYFMSSTCFKCFVNFIVRVLDLPKPQQFRIVFLSNPRMPWQDRGLDALRSIAVDIVHVQAA